MNRYVNVFNDKEDKKIILFRHSYMPIQPWFELKLENYIEDKLDYNSRLSKQILLFYQFKVKESIELVSVIADGCIDILFCCSDDKPSANICGSVIKCKSIKLIAGCEYFGVRLLPCKAIKILNCSIKDFMENEIPLVDIMKKDLFIVEKISQAKSFLQRKELFVKEIVYNESFYNVPDMLTFAIKNIFISKGVVNINQLSKDYGYSDRYLRKTFQEYLGFSPKLFAQIVRMQNALSLMIKNDEYNIMDIMHECGYYDQAHLINDFKRFVNHTPRQIKLNILKKII